jgi:CTP:molybdopterin cytidylyltransferase MocA
VIAGLILAAGAGTRFGDEPKQLADLHGRPLLEWAVAAQSAVPDLERIVVVLGAHAEQIMAGADLMDAEPVVCGDWESGQAASLLCGLRALGPGVAKVIVTLGDAPLITPQVVAMFVDQPPRSRALYGGRPGHPVVLGRAQIAAAADLTGDRGAGSLLRGGREVEAGHLCSGRDVDTPEDLEAIRDEARAVI